MSYSLDANVCIELLRGHNPTVATKFVEHNPQEIVVCSVVRAELFFGAFRSSNPDHALATVKKFLDHFQSLPFDDDVVEIYGELRAFLTKNGNLIGPNDLLIAAIALAHNVTLVTHNTREFSRVPNLDIEDWQEPEESGHKLPHT
ncbi:type II toxin-antitoxin system VapC family toxin [Candidatus Parabeggiatoa sp. HSG14]|uniref:type II toxin-antitoxin system tRNA(fMet)-specific endonuclease VapC n=1 Tax=Candidatus Parabeggiatoa sp. HSG14 TaxID=3055593 RepID=UPI0025A83601|nr:type II toxin-antitoxin system VapC family toxin [Thiotrichales bacterium HSG14]